MNPYYQGKLATIYHGDCRGLSLENITALVTDPPYELGFMGKAWDQKGVSFQKETWQHLRGLCLSGAPLLSFGGTRTFHRIACAIEDAGWEIRDTIMWVYGSGFPKSLDIAKAIDKMQGNEREMVGTKRAGFGNRNGKTDAEGSVFLNSLPESLKHIPTTKGNTAWEGYGTALKPAYEPIILGMNPLDGTFAENALKHKVAGLNIDGCRIGTQTELHRGRPNTENNRIGAIKGYTQGVDNATYNHGRFPANFIHDGSQLVLELFPESSITGNRRNKHRIQQEIVNTPFTRGIDAPEYTDNGSAARFFYCAKASKAERDRGLEAQEYEYRGNGFSANISATKLPRGNNHPTVKPLALMEYLVKLVKMPEYNLVLDPFMGSGTTLLACIRLGIPCIGIDNDEHTCEIAARRCENIDVRTPQMG